MATERCSEEYTKIHGDGTSKILKKIKTEKGYIKENKPQKKQFILLVVSSSLIRSDLYSLQSISKVF